MKSIKEIRSELREVRSFNSFWAMFGSKDVLPEQARELVDKYEDALSTAPARLQVYYQLYYCKALKQEAISKSWGFSLSYMKMLSLELCEYLQSKIA